MACLPIRKHPDPVLRKVCDPVTRFDGKLQALAQDMLQTMYDAPGRGLAAPQVGLPVRLFVMDATWKEGARTPLVCVNPAITALGKDTHAREERCLSIPDRPVTVTRPARILMRYQDTAARAQEVELTRDAAAIAQHEADHLDGRLCIDYAEAP